MIVIPFSVDEFEYTLFIGLQDDSLERMKEYDPAQIEVSKMPAEFRRRKLGHIIVGYMTDADLQHVMRLEKSGNMAEGLKYLTQGFKFRPERGDHDGPPMSLSTNKGEKIQ